MLEQAIEKFDDHCLLYFAGIGFVLGLFNVPANPFPAAFGMTVLGGFTWYIGKAILTTADTITTWDERHPEEPMFKTGEGCLTAYDSEICRRTGVETARELHRLENQKHE
jgi:hypothetical protein